MKITVEKLLEGVTKSSVKEQKSMIKAFAEQNGNENKYDSTADTLKHIKRVNELLLDISTEFLRRAKVHDNSKLEKFEKEAFDRLTPALKGTTYGSEEYNKNLVELGEALEHHYDNNSHHPEHYAAGIDGMDLFDLLEMIVDWKAATERHADGDILKSLIHNKKRFDISDQLSNILENTVVRMKLVK